MLDKIREAEKASHIEIYSKAKLFESGSWLQKPVKTVMNILPLFGDYKKFIALDLGCGVGRNSIPTAQNFKGISCRIDCVDILDFAINELNKYTVNYGVSNQINGIVSAIDDYEIQPNTYDFIMAISALEHICSEQAFVEKLQEISKGIRDGGVVCLIVNSEIKEVNKENRKKLAPQFEVNLKTYDMLELIKNAFKGWKILKSTIREQRYDIPRENCIADLTTNVVTLVARKH